LREGVGREAPASNCVKIPFQNTVVATVKIHICL
jgi:hypothetical protein